MGQLKGRLREVDHAVAIAASEFVRTHGTGWVTADELLRDHPEIGAHCKSVSDALNRLMQHQVIPQYCLAVCACSKGHGTKFRNIKKQYFITLVNEESGDLKNEEEVILQN